MTAPDQQIDVTPPRAARRLGLRDGADAVRHFLVLFWVQTAMLLSYAGVWVRATVFRAPLSPDALSRVHRKNARRFKEMACRLKGANVKLGQVASMQAHILPPEYIEELRSMRDAVPPTDYPRIARLIESELGKAPLELFADFAEVPMAAASMAQVHVAHLPTGEKVAVKILHPGLETSVAIDLALVRSLCRTLGMFVPTKLDLMQILREYEEPLRLELDLHHEGEATDVLRRALAPLGVAVPNIHWRYCSGRVLTMEFIEGVKIDDLAQLDAWKVDREKLMATYLQAFLTQALEGGFFHADPHPGNALCTREGNLALIDFGMVKRLPDNVRLGLMKEILGGFFNNPKIYTDGIIEKGAIGESDRGAIEAFATRIFNDPAARGMIFDHHVESAGEVTSLIASVQGAFEGLATFRTPQDNLMFMRALSIVVDVTKEVLPGRSPSELAMPVMAPIFAKFMLEHPEYLAVDMPRVA